MLWNKHCILNKSIPFTKNYNGNIRHSLNQQLSCSYDDDGHRALYLLLSFVGSPSSFLSSSSSSSRIRKRTVATPSSWHHSAYTVVNTLLRLLISLLLLLVLSSQVDNCHGLSLSLISSSSFTFHQTHHVFHHTRQQLFDTIRTSASLRAGKNTNINNIIRRSSNSCGSFKCMTTTFMAKKRRDAEQYDYGDNEKEDLDDILETIDDGDDDDDGDIDEDFLTDDIESLWLLGDEDEDGDTDDIDNEERNDTKKKKMKATASSTSSAIASIAARKDVGAVTKAKPLSSPPSKLQQQQRPDINTLSKTSSSSSSIQTAAEPRPRGVGRKGYNVTLLHSINYDQTQYSAAHTVFSYDLRIQLLEEYFDIHGDIDVPFRYNVTVDDYDPEGHICGNYVIHLGRWLHWVRTLYKKDLEIMNEKTTTMAITTSKNTSRRGNKIPSEYVHKLNSMNMNWKGVGARRRPNDFRKKCAELQEFIAAYGHSYVPKNWVENKSLAMWAERQRFLYRRRKKLEEGIRIGREDENYAEYQHQLTDDRVEMLRAIGFDFQGSFSTAFLGDKGRNKKGNGERDMNMPVTSGSISKHGSGDNQIEHLGEVLEEVSMNQNQIDFNKDWWNTFDLLQKYKNVYGHCNITINNCQGIMTDNEVVRLSYWILEQKRQYMIFNGNDTIVKTETSHHDSTTPKINFKCLLTPERLKALTDLGFDFSLDEFNLSLPGALSLPSILSLILPWQNMVEYNFDCQKMLNLLERHNDNTGECNISLDDKNIMARITMAKDETTKSTHDENADVNLALLYFFQQRMRWENRHQSIRSQVDQMNWILEQEETDVGDALDEIGFSWYDQEIPDSSNVWAREIEWWCNYYDLCRYKRSNGDFALDPHGKWYSEELVDWLEEQRQNFVHMIKGTGENDEARSNGQEIIYFNEWHLQALHDIGLDLNDEEYSYYTQTAYMNGPKPVGRPPAILKLEKDLESQYNNLPDDLQSIVNNSANRKRVDKAEQLAWLVRYEALRRLYSLHGRGSLSTLSTDKDVCDQRLALWAGNQRKQYANYLKGNKSALTPSRIKLLEEINFDWELQSEDDEWEEMKAALMRFKKEHCHCFVPAAYSKDLRLGQWVHLQRQLYQLSKRDDIIDVAIASKLSEEKAKELIDSGLDLTMDNFSFGNIAFETMWRCRVEELQRFKEEHGHCNVILDYSSKYYDLSLWVNEQRILYHRAKEGIDSQLDSKRMKDLEKLGFLWYDGQNLSENSNR